MEKQKYSRKNKKQYKLSKNNSKRNKNNYVKDYIKK